MSKIQKVSLLDTCTINMGQSPESSTYNQEGEGLPFFQGKADFGELYPSVRYYCSGPKKIAQKGDLLLSVRAPIGALNIATEECCIGRGLAALTAKPAIDTKYLYYALFSLNNELNARGTGSTFKAINKQDLAEVSIPLPSLQKQQRISTTLDVVSEVLRLRKAQLAELDNLVKSQFIEMFGDPITNPKGWPLEKFGVLGELNRGVSKHRPRNSSELLGGPYPLVQTGEVSNAGLYITEYTSTYSEIGLAQSRMWPKGTLCITIAANIAQTAILAFDACFPDSVVGFIPSNRTSQMYIHYWFGFFQKILEEQAPQVAQKNINLKILNELEVMLPPIELQEQFADFVRQADKSKLAIHQSLDETQRLFDSLMAEYFED